MSPDSTAPGDALPESLPTALRGFVGAQIDSKPLPRLRVAALPRHYTPKVAGYARGPFVTGLVTPSAWRWRNTRTVVVTSDADGLNYRAVRVLDTSRTPEFIGYWAVELLGTPLTELEG